MLLEWWFSSDPWNPLSEPKTASEFRQHGWPSACNYGEQPSSGQQAHSTGHWRQAAAAGQVGHQAGTPCARYLFKFHFIKVTASSVQPRYLLTFHFIQVTASSVQPRRLLAFHFIQGAAFSVQPRYLLFTSSRLLHFQFNQGSCLLFTSSRGTAFSVQPRYLLLFSSTKGPTYFSLHSGSRIFSSAKVPT